MSDLISRTKLMEDFRKTITENSDTFDWLNMIQRQPTAYDPDKVVKELEKLQTYNMGLATLMSDLQRNGVYRHYICREEAIEIVKQVCFGKDDVCEWKCDEYGRFHTECHYLADNDPLEYTYCPYCGKKIKIVGD